MQSVSEAPGPAAVFPKSRGRFRALVLRLATLAALVALYLGGVWVRTASFQARGHRQSDQFWVESAQHFRNVRMVAEGGTIPALDIDLEYPDGLVTRSHTIHGEYAIGLLGRWLPFERIGRYASSHTLFGIYLARLLEPFWPVQAPTLSSFVRYFVRLSICTLIFWAYLIVRELTGSRWAGLLAAALYAFSFGSVSRSLGDTFYHEHVALPLLGLHLWFFYRALNRDAIGNALLCAVFLLASLLTWKVIEFYFLVLILYFFLMTLGPGLDRRSLRVLGCIVAVILLGSVLLDVHLRYNRFYVSKGMLGAYSCLAAAWLVKRRGAKWKYSVLPIALALLVFKSIFLPDTVKYNHVWLTFFYRFRYLHKPLDPSLLPFDVRHYWVPPYVSPNLFAFLNEVFWPVALAVPALLSFVVFLLLPSGWKPAQWSAEHRSKAFLLLGFGCFLLFYLLFYKIKTFLLLFSIPWTGYLWVRWRAMYMAGGPGPRFFFASRPCWEYWLERRG